MIEYPTKILLATDGTDDSIRAAHVAVALSSKTGAELYVAHVAQASSAPTSGASATGSPPLPSVPYEHFVKRAEILLEQQVERVRSAGGVVTEAYLRMERPAHEVIALSAELGADLLVVGSGRPRPVRRAVTATMRRDALGSAADAIVRGAHCPVLVVRGEGVPQLAGPRLRF